MVIYFGTSDWEKYRTVRDHLEERWDLEVRFEPRVTLPEEPSDALGVLHDWGVDVMNIVDTAKHEELLCKVATKKVKASFQYTREQPSISVDSGFFVDELGNIPGSCVRLWLKLRGGGVTALNTLLDELGHGASRKCRFSHALTYMDDRLEAPKFFKSESVGRISERVRGASSEMSEKSPLWRVFEPLNAPEILEEERNKTISEMTRQEYERYSLDTHTYLTDLGNWLKENRAVKSKNQR